MEGNLTYPEGSDFPGNSPEPTAGAMLTFSTDHLRPQDRFQHWCDVRGKSLFGVTLELDPERRPDFHGQFVAAPMGRATLIEMRASTYRMERHTSDIARVQGDSLCIGSQVSGPGWTHTCGGEAHRIRSGLVTLGHSDQPFASVPDAPGDFVYRVLKLPLSAGVDFCAPVDDLVALPLHENMRLTGLVGAMFSALTSQPPETADASTTDLEHIFRLALMARGRISFSAPGSREALRTGCLYAARSIIDREFYRPQLAPAMVAAMLGISVRQLHLVFEPTGMSFARTLMKRRLESAHRMLVSQPHRSVLDVAFSCGFDGMATFYRAFRTAYGLTPGDLRHGAVRDP